MINILLTWLVKAVFLWPLHWCWLTFLLLQFYFLFLFFFAKWCKVECRYVKGKVLSSQLCCISLCSYDNNNDRYATVTVCYSTFSLQIHFSRLIYSNRNRNVGHSSCHITFQKSWPTISFHSNVPQCNL